MQRLVTNFHRLLQLTDTSFQRYLYERIDWDNRMTAILGPRGTGKTTMLLQRIKMQHQLSNTLYVKADDLYFTENKLYELAEEFHSYGGKYLFIDEIHKYENWSQELKMIYDYLPALKVVFTGSSVLDIIKGYADLSRRVLTYHMHGLSFREFLYFKTTRQLAVLSMEDVLSHQYQLEDLKILPLFNEYLESGYYPFFKESGYHQRLLQTIDMILEVDIPIYAKMNITTAQKLKKLLFIISKSVPFKPNFSKLAELTGIHRNSITDYINYLEKAGLLNQLRESTEGIRLLGKVEKLYLNNTNLMYALAESAPDAGNTRETFFLNQLSVDHQVHAAKKGDFLVGDKTFEVGGKHKKQQQVSGVDEAFVVKDGIETGFGNVVPLWAFGMLY